MIKISPFTPLFFNPSSDTTGIKSRYMQTFARTDRIFVEIIADGGDVPSAWLNDKVENASNRLSLLSWAINSSTTVYFTTIQMLAESIYSVTIEDMESELFRVTEDSEELAHTKLIQCSMRNNRQRMDSVFFIENMQYFFEFRVPGGFKDVEWGFNVDSEQFVTADSDIVSLYAKESTQKMLTVGGAIGCPIWFADHLNRILCCDYVYVDGVRFCRAEESVPEVTEVLEGSRSIVFKQMLQEVRYIEPEMPGYGISLRKLGDGSYRKISDGDLRKIN